MIRRGGGWCGWVWAAAAALGSIPGCGFMQRWLSTTGPSWQSRAYPASSIPPPTSGNRGTSEEPRPSRRRGVVIFLLPCQNRTWKQALKPGDHVSVVGGKQAGEQEPEPWGTSEEDLGSSLLCHTQLHHHWEVKDKEVELQEVWGAEGESARQAHVRPKSPFRKNQQVSEKVFWHKDNAVEVCDRISWGWWGIQKH